MIARERSRTLFQRNGVSPLPYRSAVGSLDEQPGRPPGRCFDSLEKRSAQRPDRSPKRPSPTSAPSAPPTPRTTRPASSSSLLAGRRRQPLVLSAATVLRPTSLEERVPVTLVGVVLIFVLSFWFVCFRSRRSIHAVSPRLPERPRKIVSSLHWSEGACKSGFVCSPGNTLLL